MHSMAVVPGLQALRSRWSEARSLVELVGQALVLGAVDSGLRVQHLAQDIRAEELVELVDCC